VGDWKGDPEAAEAEAPAALEALPEGALDEDAAATAGEAVGPAGSACVVVAVPQPATKAAIIAAPSNADIVVRERRIIDYPNRRRVTANRIGRGRNGGVEHRCSPARVSNPPGAGLCVSTVLSAPGP